MCGASETEGAYYNDAKYLEGCEVIGNIYENAELLAGRVGLH